MELMKKLQNMGIAKLVCICIGMCFVIMIIVAGVGASATNNISPGATAAVPATAQATTQTAQTSTDSVDQSANTAQPPVATTPLPANTITDATPNPDSLDSTLVVAAKLYGSMGATFSKTQSSGLTTLNITINQDALVADVPQLQQDGILNSDITQTGVNILPNMIAAFIMQYIASSMIDSVYDDKSVDKLKVNEYLDVADDYGNMKHRLAISFDFTRHLDEKIDWDNFKQESLPKIAPNFVMTQWFAEKLYSESQQQ